MFDFLNRWRRLSPNHQMREAPGAIIRLLVVTQDDNLYLSVHGVATECGWETRMVRTVERGLQALDEFPASVAIYDWPGTEEDWRFEVDRLTARPDHPSVLLASPVDDEYLCAELVRHGGFDVIPRSADADRLIRNVQFAHFFRRNKVRGGGSFVR
jgi:DNA-binding response OmpR family regulator